MQGDSRPGNSEPVEPWLEPYKAGSPAAGPGSAEEVAPEGLGLREQAAGEDA